MKLSDSPRRFLAALLILALLASPALAQNLQTGAAAPASVPVKLETIREVTAALASEEMQGRGTMQPGGEKAARYIADYFSKLGLKPLGDDKNSYFQSVKFKETVYQPETSLKVGEETFKLGPDFAVAPPVSGDESASGDLVFIAYGMVSSVPKRDDLAGVNVMGKVVVMIQGPPQNVSEDSWKKAQAQIEIMVSLVKRGVAGIIYVSNGREEHPYAEMSDYLTRRQLERADEDEWPEFLPPFLTVSDQTAEKLFSASGTTFRQAMTAAEGEGFKPISLKKSAKITVRLKKSKGAASNVVGLLEGSDPKLKDEAVVFTAHYDAYGVGANNRVYPGAADNALGVGEMIAIAEAFSKSAQRPRRSMIFLAVTGEEYGLYGSEYWAEHPTWKIKQVAANINLDGMGTEVYGPVKTIVGYGAEHSSLGSILNESAAAAGLKIIPDPRPDENSFYRSDHYAFVKKGIPALMILGAPAGETSAWIERMKQWEKTDYHQPTDTVRADWNWDGPHTVALLGAAIALRVANEEKMPSWLQSSPFNRERGTKEEPPPMP
ncbi:MAG TPA: M28 family peptidase [Pyrinomonadaceae bacterium]|nr:M28 family peptidase [Pyrinomonadaceae bacterium]